MFKYRLNKFLRGCCELTLVLSQFFVIFLHFKKWEFIPQKEIFQANFILNFIGVLIIVIASIIILIAIKDLGSNLSPFPRPKAKSNLTTSGIYSFMRHPMYYSLILISYGIFLNKLSTYYFGLTVSLILIIKIKIILEEQYLINKFSSYLIYKNKVKY